MSTPPIHNTQSTATQNLFINTNTRQKRPPMPLTPPPAIAQPADTKRRQVRSRGTRRGQSSASRQQPATCRMGRQSPWPQLQSAERRVALLDRPRGDGNGWKVAVLALGALAGHQPAHRDSSDAHTACLHRPLTLAPRHYATRRLRPPELSSPHGLHFVVVPWKPRPRPQSSGRDR